MLKRGWRRRNLAEIEEMLASVPDEDREQMIRSLARDPRAGARSLARKYARRERRIIELVTGFTRLGQLERQLVGAGFANVAGADEVGRGALAGPLVAGAAIMPLEFDDVRLRESKQLTAELREELAEEIKGAALAWYVAGVDPQIIDTLGIQAANLRALREALLGLRLVPDYAVIDRWELPELQIPHLGLPGGDKMCLSVAAASVIAKVTRDRIMTNLDAEYPQYGFAQHKGYGTIEHRKALERHGPCPIHRRSFAPASGQMSLDVDGWD